MRKVIVLVFMFVCIVTINAAEKKYLNEAVRLIDKDNLEIINVETGLFTIDAINQSDESEMRKLIDSETFLYLNKSKDLKRLKNTFQRHENVILSNLIFDNDRVLLQGNYYYIGNYVPSEISEYKTKKKYAVYTLFNVVYLICK